MLWGDPTGLHLDIQTDKEGLGAPHDGLVSDSSFCLVDNVCNSGMNIELTSVVTGLVCNLARSQSSQKVSVYRLLHNKSALLQLS